MNDAVAEKLLRLNRQFYQTFALQFSSTRQRLQPGVQRIMKEIPPSSRLLDLGCGNGELWLALRRNGHQGEYIGLDFSPGLLAEARQKAVGDPKVRFITADLSTRDWALDLPEDHFDVALAFAVLHHLPGTELRESILHTVHRLLAPQGRFIHSEWQFLNSDRLRRRIQPWEKVELSPEAVDHGDYLMDWRHGGSGLRYVHHFNPDELASLAEATGFRIQNTFYSDGEGGNLGLYQVWVKLS